MKPTSYRYKGMNDGIAAITVTETHGARIPHVIITIGMVVAFACDIEVQRISQIAATMLLQLLPCDRHTPLR